MSFTMTPAKQRRKDYDTYLGSREDYYVERFERLRDSGGVVSWNWSAFWFGGMWAFYRKLWIPGAAAIMAQVLVAEALPGPYKALAWLTDVPFAMLANWLYWQQAERHVTAARALGGDESDVRIHLITRGGVTYLPFVVAAVLWVTWVVARVPLPI